MPLLGLKTRKFAGITFTKNQMWDLARRIRDVPIRDNITALDRVCTTIETGNIGIHFRFFYAPEGMDEDKDEFEKRMYMHILAIRNPEPDETAHEFSDVHFDESDPHISKALEWLTGLGYSVDELKARWMTLPERSLTDSWRY